MTGVPPEGPSPRRFEAYTRWSLYALLVLLGVSIAQEILTGAVTAGAPPAARWAVVALVGLHIGTGVAACSRRLAGTAGGHGVVVAAVLLGVGSALGFVLLSDPQGVFDTGAGAFWAAPALMATTFTVLGVDVSWRRVGPALVAVGPLLAGAFAARGMTWPGALSFAIWTPLVAVAGVATGQLTWWMLEVVRTLVRSRAAHARLAVAEERLRFSRDLHDVYGRTLSAIALKSELGAELARRGDARAVAEMEAVREMAQEALAQVRGIVRGYREIDPMSELAGARSVLRAAGARVDVEGLDTALTALDGAGRTACAWVLREATTNILRHSDAALVRIRAGTDEDRVRLEIRNDGLRDAGSGGRAGGAAIAVAEAARPAGDTDVGGIGLIGLAERLREVGGTLATERRAASFVLTATIPAPARPLGPTQEVPT